MYEEISIQIPYTAAGTASRGQFGWAGPVGLRIQTDYVKIQADTAVATHATDYSTYTVKRYRAGTPTTLFTFTTNSSGGAALTQWTPSSMTVDAGATGTALELIQGDTLVAEKTESGSGKAGGATIFFCAIEDRRGSG
jgi:hypothetical protein